MWNFKFVLIFKYYYGNRIKKYDIGRHIARMKTRNEIKILVAKQEEEIPLGRPRHSWMDIVIVNLKGILCEDMDWREIS